MSLSFLYQTRTIQRAWRLPATRSIVRYASSRADDNDEGNIPFDFGHGTSAKKQWRSGSDMTHEALKASNRTLSPSEAHIFKNIFDEITAGNMPKPRRPSTPPAEGGGADSILQSGAMAPKAAPERMTEFRNKYLEAFPQSVRNAAKQAFNILETPSETELEEMSPEDRLLWEKRARYQEVRDAEKKRMEAKMEACQDDFELWQVMEREVFSLMGKLGVSQGEKTKKTKSRGGKMAKLQDVVERESVATTPSEAAGEKDNEHIMDIHGALYSHYLLHALKLFNTQFAIPSPYTFQILPQVKSLGLTSYILGVSTSFYTNLASIHWNRFGDASSALDLLEEMHNTGLYADYQAEVLLGKIRQHVASCQLGLQGPFAKAITDVAPFDASLTGRLEELEHFVRYSMRRDE
ncbi:uncharacterized protein J7T54_001181 [Emericellopsis cladophorae]|uniref:Mtf2-like C-terminal domain-containing protein n=1 Tax=Emericellopsis cladophorae TaxID=2686198 RepID=A0A9Q0BCC8_9HYPO|nr:uncharacterized protein J7T54_001181 [Emericellopsis cladophorae]KAI6780677.1 hypothetical protein J7T54_001181 [Emericellopsis cladophorae]